MDMFSRGGGGRLGRSHHDAFNDFGRTGGREFTVKLKS